MKRLNEHLRNTKSLDSAQGALQVHKSSTDQAFSCQKIQDGFNKKSSTLAVFNKKSSTFADYKLQCCSKSSSLNNNERREDYTDNSYVCDLCTKEN